MWGSQQTNRPKQKQNKQTNKQTNKTKTKTKALRIKALQPPNQNIVNVKEVLEQSVNMVGPYGATMNRSPK